MVTTLSGLTTYTKVPSAPRWMAVVGIVNTDSKVLTCNLMLTNWLGNKLPSALANSAFSLIVPVAASMLLSVVLTLPVASWLRSSRSQASTTSGSVPLSLRLICGKLASGMANTTLIGCVCVMLTKPFGSLVRTILPKSACLSPRRPLMGAVILVKLSCSLALSTWAWSLCTVACNCWAIAAWVSTCWLAIESLANRSL